jgi:multimeric flavodoxin WrbA
LAIFKAKLLKHIEPTMSHNMKTLVISSSSRKGGDTQMLVKNLLHGLDYEFVYLLDYQIYPYRYEGQYPEEDEFLKLLGLMQQSEQIIFASPVYWYAMSGLMKTLFDRFTGLVTTHKQIGRQLKGKRIFLLAVGSDDALPEGFEIPFKLTSKYFDMDFIGSYYCSTENLKAGIFSGSETFLNTLKQH